MVDDPWAGQLIVDNYVEGFGARCGVATGSQSYLGTDECIARKDELAARKFLLPLPQLLCLPGWRALGKRTRRV